MEEINEDIENKIIKEMEEDLKQYYEEYNKSIESDEKILKEIEKHNPNLYIELKEIMQEDEIVFGSLELIREKPNFKPENDNYKFLKNRWVNQTVNGGYEGDSFEGYVYYEIIENELYLKAYYSC